VTIHAATNVGSVVEKGKPLLTLAVTNCHIRSR